jgi:hypothetical protein
MGNYVSSFANGAAVDAELTKVANSNLSATHKITRSATIVIAASDSSEKSKAQADYVCDGIDDQEEIIAAIDALPSAGGKIQLLEGNFYLSAGLLCPSKPFILEGFSSYTSNQSMSSTVLNYVLSSPGNCLTPSNDSKPQTFRNIAIIGDGVNTQNGIYQDNAAFKQYLNILVTGITVNGVYLKSGCNQSKLQNVYVKDCPSECSGIVDYGVDNQILFCQAGRSSGLGTGGNQAFKLFGSGTLVIGCVAERHQKGFEVGNYAIGCTLIGLFVENCNESLLVGGTSGIEPRGILINGIFSNGNTVTEGGAIKINRCKGVTLISPTVYNTTSGISLSIAVNAENVNVIGGTLLDTTPISNRSGSAKFINVYGYKNENTGTATITASATTVEVTHGLAAAPTRVQLTPTTATAGKQYYVSAKAATTFTITIDSAHSADISFDWQAVV